jgi:hypothetical protein
LVTAKKPKRVCEVEKVTVTSPRGGTVPGTKYCWTYKATWCSAVRVVRD